MAWFMFFYRKNIALQTYIMVNEKLNILKVVV